MRENRENRERAGRPWSRLIPDPEWRQEEGWAKHLGLLCRLRKFQQNCPESLSQNQLSEASWVSQEWNCLCSSAPALVGWEQLRGVWHVVNYRGSRWWEGCKYILMVVTSILDSSETPKTSAMWGNILRFTLEVRFIGNIRKLPYVIE